MVMSSHLPFGVKPNRMRATRVNAVEESIAILRLERGLMDVNVESLMLWAVAIPVACLYVCLVRSTETDAVD